LQERLGELKPEFVQMISVIVEGLPKPQGSKIAGVTKDGRPFMRESGTPAHKAWRKAVHDACIIAMPIWKWETATVPVHVEMHFVFERPPSHYTSKGDLSAAGRHMKTPRVDLDKLERCVNDSLESSGVLDNDKLIRKHDTGKYYREELPADFPVDQGAVITVWYKEKEGLWPGS
jgi:Holliday junction resolvase RusA-like endonuclease